MATTAHAIAHIAELTGIDPAPVARAARALREYDTRMWPQGSQGRGQSAHVEPRHLVNLVMALAVADPITAAPRIVQGYRDMAVPGTIYLKTEGFGRIDRLLFPDSITESGNRLAALPPGNTLAQGIFGGKGGLGADLERLVELLAGLDETETSFLLASLLSVELVVSARVPMAIVGYYNPDAPSGAPEFRKINYYPQQNTLGLPSGLDPARNFLGAPAATPIVRKVQLGADLFWVLGKLWADTKEHQASMALPRRGKHTAPSHSLSDVLPGTPENETAASLPGEAAAVADQLATGKPLVGQTYGSDARENSQGAIESQAGRPVQHRMKDPAHDSRGTGGADSAAA